MKVKTIKSVLKKRYNRWINSIENKELAYDIEQNSFITGGAVASLLLGEKINDIDIYFTNLETAAKTAEYYIHLWNENHTVAKIRSDAIQIEDDRIRIFIESRGIVGVEDAEIVDEGSQDINEIIEEELDENKYKPIFITDNAISLSNKVQLIIRFVGNPAEIHKNFDFVHCTCWYKPSTGEFITPSAALLSLFTKELQYMGSRYPLCSLFRLRKFYQRGFTANAGQILKMVFQLQELDLKNFNVLKDQLIGVDTSFMIWMINEVEKANSAGTQINGNYLIDLAERLFDTQELNNNKDN